MNELTLMEIRIPDEYVELCSEWYSGQDDLLYAVSSTGFLSLGSIRPWHEDERPMTDQEWHLSLWEGLGGDVRAAVKLAHRSNHDDLMRLEEFASYVDDVTAKLAETYGIET